MWSDGVSWTVQEKHVDRTRRRVVIVEVTARPPENTATAEAGYRWAKALREAAKAAL
jgi:hypothetical protein